MLCLISFGIFLSHLQVFYCVCSEVQQLAANSKTPVSSDARGFVLLSLFFFLLRDVHYYPNNLSN